MGLLIVPNVVTVTSYKGNYEICEISKTFYMTVKVERKVLSTNRPSLDVTNLNIDNMSLNIKGFVCYILIEGKS